MSAVISSCLRFRYRLDRKIAESGKVIAFFGVNPSTADADKDDNTINRMKGFTLSHQGSRFIVGNVFSYRSPHVADLSLIVDCFGDLHFSYLTEIISEADLLVPCWGSRKKLPNKLHPHLDNTMKLLIDSKKPVYSFGITKTGDPKHPLYLSSSSILIPWESTL